MKTRQKGRRAVNKAIDYLETEEWLVADVEKTGKFVKIKDMYGLFDLACIKEDGGVMYVQVTSSRPHTHKRYIEFSKKYRKTHITFVQMVWINYKGFIVHTYDNGTKTRRKLGW